MLPLPKSTLTHRSMCLYLCMQSHRCCHPLLRCQVKRVFCCTCTSPSFPLTSLSWWSSSDLSLILIGSLPHLRAHRVYLWQWAMCALPLSLRPLWRLRWQQRRGGLSVPTVWPRRGVHLQQWPLYCEGLCLQRHQQLLWQWHLWWTELPWVSQVCHVYWIKTHLRQIEDVIAFSKSVLMYDSGENLPARTHQMSVYQHLHPTFIPVWWWQRLWRYEWREPYTLWWVQLWLIGKE